MSFSEGDPIFQVMTLGRHAFPGIWRYILPEDFSWFSFPRESVCTCEDCLEVTRGNYHPDCRCCNHFPHLPNFSIGLALLDPRRRSYMKQVIDSRQGLPQGLRPTPRQYEAAVTAYSRDMFGKSPELNCVFMDLATFKCKVYEYRNGICGTFFCENDHGSFGRSFWGAVEDIVVQIEFALELWCIEKMGMGTVEYLERVNGLAEIIDGVSDEKTGKWAEIPYRILWDNWHGREVEFYEGCARLVMENRDRLYQIACRQSLLRPLEYERQERLQVPKEHRHEAPEIPIHGSEVVSVDVLWYKLQVAYRRLTEIPFNDGMIQINDDVEIEPKPRDRPPGSFFADKTHFARRALECGKWDDLYLTAAQEVALRLFERPRVIGEKLFENPQVVALEDPREFLAKCLRRGFLIRTEDT